jgi:hypothetical protein
MILDYIANGASKVIDIVFDGVYNAAETKYTYGGEEYTLTDGVLEADAVFGEAPKAE